MISEARLAELRAMPYEEYLLTPEWQTTRKRILIRDDYQCQGCHVRNVVFNVHHYTYARLGCELDEDLVTLCEECHTELHRLLIDPPKLSFSQKCSIGISAALLGTIGIEGFLQAPLPAEVGVLIVAYLLAKNSPTIYAQLKEMLPAEVMAWLGRAPTAGKRSMLDIWLGREPKVLPADVNETEEEETSDEEIALRLREIGLPEEEITEYLHLDADEREQETLTSHGLPGLSLFGAPQPDRALSPERVRALEQQLQSALRGLSVYARVEPEATRIGPRILQFGVIPTRVPLMQDGLPRRDETGRVMYSRRTRIEEVTRREKDIQLALGAKSIRLLAPVPGKHYVGIEIPNPVPASVPLSDVLASPPYRQACASSKLVVALGRDVAGEVCFCDIEKAPHVLIGGTTNSGKSMLVNVLIASLLTQATPADVRLLMIDPKQVELTPYNGIAHLLAPVVADMEEVVPLLKRAVAEMERRYGIFVRAGVRKLSEYRKKREQMPELENLPAWVIIIDEFADLMMTAPAEVEEQVCRLAQKGRAAGVHLVIATQKPVVKVITGLIKGNMPTSIALKTKTEVDSRVILDQGGAERLLGSGDLLYLPPDTEAPIRIQGAYMTTAETEALVAHWQRSEAAGEMMVFGQKREPDTEDLEETTRTPYLRIVGDVTRSVEHEGLRNSPKMADFDHYDATRNAHSGEPEPAPQQAVRGQSEDATRVSFPSGWTEEKVALLPGFYRMFGNLDRCLDAVELSTHPRNRDFAREILKKQGLWKEK